MDAKSVKAFTYSVPVEHLNHVRKLSKKEFFELVRAIK